MKNAKKQSLFLEKKYSAILKKGPKREIKIESVSDFLTRCGLIKKLETVELKK